MKGSNELDHRGRVGLRWSIKPPRIHLRHRDLRSVREQREVAKEEGAAKSSSAPPPSNPTLPTPPASTSDDRVRLQVADKASRLSTLPGNLLDWQLWIERCHQGFPAFTDGERPEIEKLILTLPAEARQLVAGAIDPQVRGGKAPAAWALLDWLFRGFPAELGKRRSKVGFDEQVDRPSMIEIAKSRLTFFDPTKPPTFSGGWETPWGESRGEAFFANRTHVRMSSFKGRFQLKSTAVAGTPPPSVFHQDRRLTFLTKEGDGLVTRGTDVEPDHKLRVVSDGQSLFLDGVLHQVEHEAQPTAAERAKLKAETERFDQRPENKGRARSVDQLRKELMEGGRRPLAFAGFAAAGHQDPQAIEAEVRRILATVDPKQVVILSDGGPVARIAKELGFETAALRSRKGADHPIDPAVGKYAFAGDTWGECADVFGAIASEGALVFMGGNEFTEREVMAALRQGGSVFGLSHFCDQLGNLPRMDYSLALRHERCHTSERAADLAAGLRALFLR